MTKLALKPGTLIVLEGLDKTGKTTQSQELRRLFDLSTTRHVHMPSGFTAFTDETYSMLESSIRTPQNGLAKQLAHLACHAESVPQITELLESTAVILDRWWWSTLAYGWYSGDISATSITESTYRALIDGIWSELKPSVVFLFDRPYDEDANNSDPILAGYRLIAAADPGAVLVPQANPEIVTSFILDELRRRSLLATI